MERQITKSLLRREMEGYRRVAFPSGGARTIRTRDGQNHALVARGGYLAIQRLLELLESLTLDQLKPEKPFRVALSEIEGGRKSCLNQKY